jgi:RES domain-containing protein
MLVYRISKTKHATDLTGEGARLNGGRWNHKLPPCIYTSETRALALLEYSVNTNIQDIPRSLSITTIEIPDVHVLRLTTDDLPSDWKDSPAPSATKDFGTELLMSMSHAVIEIPSAEMQEEFNYLLNPRHKEARVSGLLM